jgi:hypothetical protein
MFQKKKLRIDGVPEKDLDICLVKISEFQAWAKSEKIDRWALRAALLKALDEDADGYFAKKTGTFREIAAFDNGVAKAIESLREE